LSNTDVIDFVTSDDPVWLLGRQYSTLHQLPELRDDFRSRVWITYRKAFAPIGGNGPSSDQGWGCMLRCGQMVLAQALIMNKLGRDWRWIGCQKWRTEDELKATSETESQSDFHVDEPFDEINREREMKKFQKEKEYHEKYLTILKQFQDKKKSPYSIHQIALMSATDQKPVGTWLGPNMIAQTLKKLSQFDHWNNLTVYVAMDNVVIIEDIKEHVASVATPSSTTTANATSAPSTSSGDRLSNDWKPLLLFIPLRLGLTEINSVYFKALKTSLSMKHTLGIIGGRPNHALYFVGFSRNELIYLDPHTTQPMTDLDEFSGDESFCDDNSYHCRTACRMDIGQLDPSISLCFFFQEAKDFDLWCSSVAKFLLHDEKQPLFELCEFRPKHWICEESNEHHDANEYDLGVASGTDKTDTDDGDDEEFELLG
jgi:cysteine protease ATG4